MLKLSMEDEAKLSVVMTGLLEVKKADNATGKLVVAFTDSLKGTEFDVPTSIALIDEALAEMASAADILRLFRNILRDDRKPFIKRMAKDRHSRDVKMGERDPVEYIDEIVKRRRKQETG